MSSAALDDLAARLERALGRPPGRDVPLSDLSTYRLGGPAALLVTPNDLDELLAVASVVAGADLPVLVVGKGSNLLVADSGFPGLAIRLTGAFETLDTRPDAAPDTVAAGAAVPLPVLARQSASAGRAGLEFYVGIPGTVGGAVRMNAGGHGRESSEVVESAALVDLDAGGSGERTLGGAELGFGYRHSVVGRRHVVTRAVFRVADDDPDACRRRIGEIVRWRRENQPGGSNAGSVFRNPPDDSAGRLIDACGLKGLRVGAAVVSEKHANFFQADQGARADDVRRLVAEVRRRVFDATGVDLRPELHMVGFDDDQSGEPGGEAPG